MNKRGISYEIILKIPKKNILMVKAFLFGKESINLKREFNEKEEKIIINSRKWIKIERFIKSMKKFFQIFESI